MSKLQIVGPKTILDDCINTLHELSVLHIEPVSLQGYDEELTHIPVDEEKMSSKISFEDTLLKAENLMAMLPAPAKPPKYIPDTPLEDIAIEVDFIDDKIKTLFLEKEDLEDEIHHLTDYEKLLSGFVPIASELGGLKNYEIIGLTIDTKRVNVIELLEKEVDKLTQGKYEIHTSMIDEHTTGLILAVTIKDSSSVRRLFFGEGIQELKLPEKYEDKPLLEAISGMAEREKLASKRLQEVKNELIKIAETWYKKLEYVKNEAQSKLEEIAALRHFAQTRYCFIIEGWVPEDRYNKIKTTIKEKYGDKILVKKFDLTREEKSQAPVFIHNLKWIKPFEVFLKALPTPKYGSVDPTPLIAFFFPAFFGIIVGDMGYGLSISLIGFSLRFKFKTQPILRDLMSVFVACGVSAFFFGFLFGELFGNLGEKYHIVHPVWFDRVKFVNRFLIISLGIGVGHVLLGFLTGLFNKLRQKNMKAALVKFLFFLLISSFIVLILGLFKLVPAAAFTPVFLVFIGIFITLLVLEGILGLVEFVESISNILSYVRIMAIGTSSVILAMVANKVGEAMGNITIGITVAALIHIMNIIISMMSPTIQSMRLQYVEFLGKFYEDGGKPYKPFKK